MSSVLIETPSYFEIMMSHPEILAMLIGAYIIGTAGFYMVLEDIDPLELYK